MAKKTQHQSRLEVALIVTLNVIFWGGLTSVAIGFRPGSTALGVFIVCLLAIGWGTPVFFLGAHFIKTVRRSGSAVAFREAGEFLAILGAWLGFILLAIGAVRTCKDFASRLAPNPPIYYLVLVSLLFCIGTSIRVILVSHKEGVDREKRRYQIQLLKEAYPKLFDLWSYSPFRTPAFDRISIEQYHEMLLPLVRRGAEEEPPAFPGFVSPRSKSPS